MSTILGLLPVSCFFCADGTRQAGLLAFPFADACEPTKHAKRVSIGCEQERAMFAFPFADACEPAKPA